MNLQETMVQAAQAGMTHVLGLRTTDTVLVVTDHTTADCGKAFALAAENLGCQTTLYQLPDDQRPLTRMPADMHGLLEGVTVVINADMMTAGPLNVDYTAMQKMADRLILGFKNAVSVHLETDLGTDLVLDLSGRKMISDLKAVPGTGANLPCGEVYCCPVENGAQGTLVIDGCFGSWGTVKSPVTISLQDGRVVVVTGEDQQAVRQIQQLMNTDDGSDTIAELGIGLNPGARLTDNMLESEKALRTAHIAFGTNQGMPGGHNQSSIHIDYLFNRPTITVTNKAGEKRLVMKRGEPI